MTSAFLLSALLTLPTQSVPAPVFQPHFTVRFQPTTRRQVVARLTDDREVVCGMVVVHKTPADDPKILVPLQKTDAAVRRIEPQGCDAKTTVTRK